MGNRMLRFFLIVFLLGFPLQLLASGTLTVGLSPDYPPLQFKQDGELMGIEVDNARSVAKILGMRLNLVEQPLEQLLVSLESGKVDVVMSGLSVTPERAQRVEFLEPYMKVGQMAIMHISKAGRFAQPWAIYRSGVRIGVEPGTTGAQFAEDELGDADISYQADPEEAFAALRSDDIDLYIHDAPTSWRLATGDGQGDLISQYRPLTSETLAWAVRQGDTRLREALEGALGQMIRNGTLDYILNRWIPVRVEVE